LDYVNYNIVVEKNLTVLANYNGSPTIKSKLELDELEKQEIDYFITDLENPDATITEGRLKAIGIKLAEALFTKDIRDQFYLVQKKAGARGVRIRLAVNHPISRSYPWESLYLNHRYLALDEETPLTRLIPNGTFEKKEIRKPVKMLVVGAQPAKRGLPTAHVARDIKNIEDALNEHQESGAIHLDLIRIGTVPNVLDQLKKTQYNVFHFIGHGIFENGTGKLAFESPEGKYDPVDHVRMGQMLMNQREMGLVVLNACQGAATSTSDVLTGLAPELIKMRIVPSVIAMRYSITNQMANLFTREFYPNLLKKPIDQNLQSVRHTISVHPKSATADFLAPVLFLNAPDGVIFKPKLPPPPTPVPAKKTEILKPQEEIPPQKVEQFPKLSAKCSDTITLLNSFMEDPSSKNDRKAWKSFKDFVKIVEQTSSEYEIEDEYQELIEIRNRLGRLRRQRNENRSAGRDELADRAEAVIQRNYRDSIRIILRISAHFNSGNS